ncbi:hypothetical protein [Polyangium sorediatum]|uniref:YkgJ family cysteine cluster protein n=1 Tax=Polyangium sorediatum TaxID=889274 RepID=A0ABT6NI30_9BACT|nr:hypothetical protein [Polyangium sorediatum]MDI1427966.1 hypothetical protein [Polyangium sorediatum]
MIRLDIQGAHTQLCSTLCAKCPQGPAGCCKAPPHMDWSDVGRVVAHDGRDFLLTRIAKKDLLPREGGLELRRVKRREAPTEPMERKCVFHGAGGCTIAPTMRPATCNYFLCEDTFIEGGERKGERSAVLARQAHGALRAVYERWDAALSARIAETFPEGPAWDAAFLDWLGEAFVRLEAASGTELSALPVSDENRQAVEER